MQKLPNGILHLEAKKFYTSFSKKFKVSFDFNFNFKKIRENEELFIQVLKNLEFIFKNREVDFFFMSINKDKTPLLKDSQLIFSLKTIKCDFVVEKDATESNIILVTLVY